MRAWRATAALAAFAVIGATAGDTPYLDPALIPDGITLLPPPPIAGSAAAEADSAIFAATRKLVGTERWRIATDDVSNDPLDRYACAMGKVLTSQTAPALAHLLDKAGTGALVDPVKRHYQARRPYLGNDAPICQARTDDLATNGDYPSGHAANGWLEGLILARLMPGRTTQILTRARQYGESRVVCGVHSHSAVEAGWMAGSAMFVALEGGSASFRRDLERAASELKSIGPAAAKLDPGRCAAEAATLRAPLD